MGGNHGDNDIWLVKVKEGVALHPLITSVSPDRGYSYTSDELNITISATGISPNAVFSLRKSGQPEILPIQVTSTSPATFECKFLLKEQALDSGMFM